MPLTFARRGVQQLGVTGNPAHDRTILDGMARAFYWQHLLDRGVMQSGSDIARAERLHSSVVTELLRLTLLLVSKRARAASCNDGRRGARQRVRR